MTNQKCAICKCTDRHLYSSGDKENKDLLCSPCIAWEYNKTKELKGKTGPFITDINDIPF